MHTDIVLRPLEAADIDEEYCRWYTNDDGHLDYFTGSGRVFDRALLLDDFSKGIESGRWFYYLIQTVETVRIGTLKIGPIDQKNRTSDLVCLIGNRAYVGRGLGAKAVALGNQLAFDRHEIRRLHSGMYATNVASIKAYVNAGWYVEATMRGYYLVGDTSVDRVCVACLNPRYFPAS